MEHSKAYKELFKQLNATGVQKKDGYYPRIMEEIYDGVKALDEMLVKCSIPSSNSVTISEVLYECTGDDKYLDVIKQNIDKDENDISYVATLSYCKPCKKAYDFLVEIYLKDNNESNSSTIRSAAVTGIL